MSAFFAGLFLLFIFLLLLFPLLYALALAFRHINPSRAKQMTGTLTGFKKNGNAVAEDSNNNKRGRKPVVLMELNGKLREVVMDVPDYGLSFYDIGKEIPVLYQNIFGRVAIINDEESINRNKWLKIWYRVVAVVIAAILIFFYNLILHIYH